MQRTLARFCVVLLAGFGLLLVKPATPAAAQTPPPSLQGETLQAGCGSLPPQDVLACEASPPPGSVSVTCTTNPVDGTAVFTFSASGTAFGPYPGTFTESGTFMLGPPGSGNTNVNPSAQDVTSFTAMFTIQSPVGTVTGTKDSMGVTQNFDSNNCDFAGANSNYVATIPDTGQSRTQVGAPTGPQAGFWESQFRSNSPPPPPPVMFAPGGGSFVIGDLESANGSHVTFWGAQWSKANPTSGGASAASFKGFAENPSMPNCNTNWSTDPGNSAPPPNGPLPPMMGVIVTGRYSKSGSTISGNTVHIVIVQTDPGYQPNLGHPGTGTVVMQVC